VEQGTHPAMVRLREPVETKDSRSQRFDLLNLFWKPQITPLAQYPQYEHYVKRI
jgi:hypothetical protein